MKHMDIRLRNMTSIFLTKGDQMLLLYRQGGRVVSNVWVGSAGGHFEQEELNDPKACVLRELEEELGLTGDQLKDLTLRYIMLRRTKGEVRQNYYYFAELREDRALSSNEGMLQWFPLEKLPELDMPFSAKQMILHYLKRGRFHDKLYCGVGNVETSVFSELPEC